jgi:hypothetical protein
MWPAWPAGARRSAADDPRLEDVPDDNNHNVQNRHPDGQAVITHDHQDEAPGDQDGAVQGGQKVYERDQSARAIALSITMIKRPPTVR